MRSAADPPRVGGNLPRHARWFTRSLDYSERGECIALGGEVLGRARRCWKSLSRTQVGVTTMRTIDS